MRGRDPRLAALGWLVAALTRSCRRASRRIGPGPVDSAGPPDGRDHRGRPRRGGEVQGHRVPRADHGPRREPEGPRQSVRGHDAGHQPRRRPGGPDLLPAPVIRTGRGIKYRDEEVSACDGERTRTVVAGNCANIHLGRWRHPGSFPSQPAPVLRRVNFPLSVYLRGTEAIHAYLSYTRELVESGCGTSSARSRHASRARNRSTASAA